MDCDLKLNNSDKNMTSTLSVNRRQFIKTAGIMGCGIVIYFSFGRASVGARMKREGHLGEKIPEDFNAFFRLEPDGNIKCFTGKVEIGQGIITSLPQMLAEELDIPYESVDIIMGDTDRCPWDAGTYGSLSTRYFGIFLREAASEAKGVLKELAAEYLKCPVENLVTKDGVIYDSGTRENKVTYLELTQGKIIEKHLKEVPPLKPSSEYKIMGKAYLRRDSRDKVTGRAQYAGDIRLPDMLYAKILRAPAHGADLMRLDLSEAEKVEGVRIVREGDLIAVLHESPDIADSALKKIKAEYRIPTKGLNNRTVFSHLLKTAPKEITIHETGNLIEGDKIATDLFDETYLNSYVAHAPIETHTALAVMENGKMTVWESTQIPFSGQQEVAEALGLPLEKVRIITPLVGGGFGGKGMPDRQAVEAALLARATGKPVQVAWNRSEEFFYDTFRPASIIKIKSGMNKKGKITLWDYVAYFAGERECVQFYDIPHQRTVIRGDWMQYDPGTHPFPVGAWRAPAANSHTHARELQINIMASKANMDPLEFRLRNLKDERMIRVLKTAANKFGWNQTKSPSGRGYGISCGMDSGTYVAHIAEVDVDKSNGRIRVKRIVCAQDMGFIVNPAGAKIQMEGCITMGLGYALAEEIRFENGKILNHNFDTYDIPKFSWLPKIETYFVENDKLSSQGGGEPAIICMGAVIASAVYDAVGAKIYQLPMTPDRVKESLKKV